MRNNLVQKGRQLAFSGLIFQIITSLVLILIVFIINRECSLDTALGAISFILPYSIFAYWTFRYAGASQTKLVVQSFSQGAKLKLAATIILFVIAFTQFNAHPLPLLGAYAITMCSQWAAMLYLRRMS